MCDLNNFGFRKKEEGISFIYLNIGEIGQKKKNFQGNFTYLTFLDLKKKSNDSVPIFNILTKFYNLGIRGKMSSVF